MERWLCAALADEGDPSSSASTSPPKSWMSALLDDVKVSQDKSLRLQTDTVEADMLREDTDVDSDSFQPSSQEEIADGVSWWLPRLQQAVAHATGKELANSCPQHPVTVVSCCSGSGAEGEVLQAGVTVTGDHCH